MAAARPALAGAGGHQQAGLGVVGGFESPLEGVQLWGTVVMSALMRKPLWQALLSTAKQPGW